MSILEKIRQAFTPVNQPKNFPRLYFIPETTTVQAPRRSSNDPYYRQAAPVKPIVRQRPETFIRRFIRRRKETLRNVLERAWAKVKGFGRSVVRWLVWRVFLPLSIIASLWIPAGNPANLGF